MSGLEQLHGPAAAFRFYALDVCRGPQTSPSILHAGCEGGSGGSGIIPSGRSLRSDQKAIITPLDSNLIRARGRIFTWSRDEEMLGNPKERRGRVSGHRHNTLGVDHHHSCVGDVRNGLWLWR
jgi:hypothetical protein